MKQFDRITQEPGVMGGKACIRGMRVTVGNVVGQIGMGRTIEELLLDYPYLEREDVLQALRYAAWLAEDRNAEPEFLCMRADEFFPRRAVRADRAETLAILSEAEKNNPPCGGDSLPPNWGEVE
jgi:uncharacterized protein (DUF433 family)